jgi:GNAT superfamily N-acetyltransferase
MTIRRATVADTDAVVGMAMRFLSEGSYRAFISRNETVARELVERVLENSEASVLVADTGESLVGMVAAITLAHPYSGQKTVSELIWWVDPSHRGTVGIRLLSALESWAKSVHAEMIQMVAPAGSGVEHIYERRGYVPVETMYQLEMST